MTTVEPQEKKLDLCVIQESLIISSNLDTLNVL